MDKSVEWELIRERKEAEEELRISYRFLEAVHRHREMPPLLDAYVSLIKAYTGCNSVGIRILDEAGGIPYRSYDGFSPQFYESESPLSINTDQCMCINVIKGSVDPGKPFYTEGGSFNMNGTTRFLATVSDEVKGRTRNVCNKEGYESVALVPFWSDGRILGLIHVADQRENMVPLKAVQMIEKAAMQLGTALHRILAEEAMRQAQARLESILGSVADTHILFDRQWRYLYVNEAAVRSIGRPREEILGNTLWGLFPDIADTELGLQYLRSMVERVPVSFEFHYPASDTWWENRFYPTPEGLAVFATDITERKKTKEALLEREALFSTVFHSSPIGIVISRLSDGLIYDVNETFLSTYGLAREEAIGHTSLELKIWTNPEERASMAELLRRKGRVQNFGAMFRRKSGQDGDLLISAELIELTGEQCVLGMFSDITELRRAEDELRRSEERYRSLFENMLEGYAYCKMLFDGERPEDFIYIDVNNAFEKLTGLRNVIGKKVTEVIPRIREANPELFEIYGRVALTGESERFETYVGSMGIWFSVSVYSPKKEYFVAVFDNITNRKKAEEEIQIRDVAIQSSISPIGMADLNGNIIFANGSYLRLWGYDDLTEIVGKHISEFALSQEQSAEVVASLLSGKGYVGEGGAVRKDGSAFDVQISANLVKSREGKPVCLMASLVDITDRKRAEKALQESERNYRNLVDNALVGVYRSTIEGRFLYVNEAMAHIFECGSPKEMLSEDVQLRYKSPKDREGFIERLKQHGAVSNYEIEVPTKDGKLVTILISATLDNGIISGMVLDITEHKRLEEQFLQAQKIEAIGLLAGGVAHDFNNILSAIIGYSEIMLMKMQGDDPLRHYLEQIMESSNRATVLTQSLLAFGRKQPINLAVIDLNRVIKGFEKFLLRLIREDIALQTVYEGDALHVLADKGQIEQVIMNLVTNARDAMPEGGSLLIATGRIYLGQTFIDSQGYGKPGEYAVVTVTDTGGGMDEPTIARIFEPFYSTKEQGKGTGLGLSMVYGTVKKHNSFITVTSEPGHGTTFTIYFPLVRVAAQAEPHREKKPVEVKGGKETILLAEDDVSLRRLYTLALKDFGYTVIEAVDGEDAISRFRENRERIQLIILDGIMPRMNGNEAYREIMALNPGIKCIFISGYPENIFTKNGMPDGKTELILKPISPVDLLTKIRAVLDG